MIGVVGILYIHRIGGPAYFFGSFFFFVKSFIATQNGADKKIKFVIFYKINMLNRYKIDQFLKCMVTGDEK